MRILPVMRITKNFINLLYPAHCAICKKNLDPSNELHVCSFCIGMIKSNLKPYCSSCGRSVENSRVVCAECRKTRFYFAGSRCACLYEGVLKELIHLFKYNKKPYLEKVLSKLMIDFVREDKEILDGIDIITFVPLQNKRLRERGFNQSRIFALNISKEFVRPLADTLEKIKLTKPQNELARDERLINLKDAFRPKAGADIKDINFLLIDDVMTTGATLSECSKALLSRGAKTVRCLTLARGA